MKFVSFLSNCCNCYSTNVTWYECSLYHRCLACFISVLCSCVYALTSMCGLSMSVRKLIKSNIWDLNALVFWLILHISWKLKGEKRNISACETILRLNFHFIFYIFYKFGHTRLNFDTSISVSFNSFDNFFPHVWLVVYANNSMYDIWIYHTYKYTNSATCWLNYWNVRQRKRAQINVIEKNFSEWHHCCYRYIK